MTPPAPPSGVSPLLPDDTALRRLPEDLPTPQAMALDAVRYCLECAEVAYARVHGTLDHLGNGGQRATFAALYLDAWAIVDQGSRLHSLLAAWRNPDGSPAVPDERNLRTLGNTVVPMRNHIQHLDERIDRLGPSGPAVWGTITWTTIRDDGLHAVCWLSGGAARPSIDHGEVRVQPDRLRSSTDHVVLGAYGDAIALSDLYLLMQRIADDFDGATRRQFVGRPSQGSDFVFRMECLPDG